MLSPSEQLQRILEESKHDFHPVVPFSEQTDIARAIDLSDRNRSFSDAIFSNLDAFTLFISEAREKEGARYLYGGYMENRHMYRRSMLFDKNQDDSNIDESEPRSLHLGTDIWGEAGTDVFTPIGGLVHSMAYNDQLGDYGATIILGHQLDGFGFYTLYGHLSKRDLGQVRSGQFISRGEKFARFGKPEENGFWPPHLHFQLIIDIGMYDGDYPGVCKKSEAGKFLDNSPDPSAFFPFM